MRVVIAKPILPYPADQGTKAVTLGMLRALGRAHEVTLVCRLLSRDEARFVAPLERETGVRVRAVLAPNRRSPLHRAPYRVGAGGGAARCPRETFYDAPRAWRPNCARCARRRRSTSR